MIKHALMFALLSAGSPILTIWLVDYLIPLGKKLQNLNFQKILTSNRGLEYVTDINFTNSLRCPRENQISFLQGDEFWQVADDFGDDF